MKKTSKEPHRIHYISGTHWDREWYRPFQEFRYLLVSLMDRVIEMLETSGEFKFFHLDGQTCILEDYLEIRPEMESRLKKLITEGKILIGPWYTMPDLFCVGDEPLIRNLLLGKRSCARYDATPMPVGFICDMFGHPSQMPQIFAGFDIGDVVLGRGTNESTTPMFFHWQAPDSSTAFVYKLQDANGYGAFAVPRSICEGTTVMSIDAVRKELAEAEGNPKLQQSIKEKYLRRELTRYLDGEAARANSGVFAIMDAMDHILPSANVGFYIGQMEQCRPGSMIEHSTLPRFFEEARSSAAGVPVKYGELREPAQNWQGGYLWLIPNCVSSRTRMKAINDNCQNLLVKWVDPWVAVANLHGAGIHMRFVEIAWRNLLINHAHDSICGCSIDQVHRDMLYRYDQVRITGEQLKARAMGFFASKLRELKQNPEEFTLAVFNPAVHRLDEVVELDIDLPPDWSAEYGDGFSGQRVKSFAVKDPSGNEIPYQLLGFTPHLKNRSRFARYCYDSDGEFIRCRIAARLNLPGMGYISLLVVPDKTPHRDLRSQRTAPEAAENRCLAIEVAANGTLTVTDKRSGEVYRNLLGFEDSAETGDGWFHGASINDGRIISGFGARQVAVVNDGKEKTAFRITQELLVPEKFLTEKETSSSECVPLKISSTVMLYRDFDFLVVETVIDNIASDHRLKLQLPTGAAGAQSYFSHHPFDFVERPIALDLNTASWREPERQEKPFLNIQAVGNGRRGLALIAPAGLHEGGVADDAARTMQVTLLRSYRKTVATGGEEDGQERGRLAFRYALKPYSGELPRLELLKILDRLQAPVEFCQSGVRSSGFPEFTGGASSGEFMEFRSGNLAFSTLKAAADGSGKLILRLWNPLKERSSEKIFFAVPPQKAELVKLNEEPALENNGIAVKLDANMLEVSAPPGKIVTIAISLMLKP